MHLCGNLKLSILYIFREVLDVQPDDVREYAAGTNFVFWVNHLDFFTNPNLKRKIESIQRENVMESRICTIANNLGQDNE